MSNPSRECATGIGISPEDLQMVRGIVHAPIEGKMDLGDNRQRIVYDMAVRVLIRARETLEKQAIEH